MAAIPPELNQSSTQTLPSLEGREQEARLPSNFKIHTQVLCDMMACDTLLRIRDDLEKTVAKALVPDVNTYFWFRGGSPDEPGPALRLLRSRSGGG
jgi:hypothetical protein